ncbi:AMED_5909 family protein [Amycolatopsis sp. lyj-108]|uniref:AMED_5909 family protein n=1 Tax=Amycolatopsis sp. lyj-108 TaxID=2789286 RepID=UPI00397E34CE
MTTPGRNEPQTLKDAHHVAAATRPLPGASLVTWLKWRRANAKMYHALSDVDRFHHHEIRYWVSHEDNEAEALAEKIKAQKTDSDGTGPRLESGGN